MPELVIADSKPVLLYYQHGPYFSDLEERSRYARTTREDMYSQPEIQSRSKLMDETDPSLSAAATGRDQSGGDR